LFTTSVATDFCNRTSSS